MITSDMMEIVEIVEMATGLYYGTPDTGA